MLSPAWSKRVLKSVSPLSASLITSKRGTLFHARLLGNRAFGGSWLGVFLLILTVLHRDYSTPCARPYQGC